MERVVRAASARRSVGLRLSIALAQAMRVRRGMDQPLWQNWLNIAFIGFVARTAALAVALRWDSLQTLVLGAHLVVLAACLFAAVAVWLSTRWVVSSLCALTATFVIASLFELGAVEPAMRVAIVARIGVALAAAAALLKLALHAQQHPES
jgi:hypothetical protein